MEARIGVPVKIKSPVPSVTWRESCTTILVQPVEGLDGALEQVIALVVSGEITLHVNGVQRQRGDLTQMIWSGPEGRLRDELLNETSFRSLAHVRDLLAEWQDDFNQNRPHTSLKGLTPNEFAARSIQDHNRNGLSL